MLTQLAIASAPRAAGTRQQTCCAAQLLVPEQSSVVLPRVHCPTAVQDGGVGAPPRPAGMQHDCVVVLQDALPHAIGKALAAPLLLAELPAPLELLELL